ncbi:MAG: NAD(P)-binding domain-containing protein, partial [Aureibaculum sp.]
MKKEISILGCGWLGEPLARKLIESGYAIKGSTTTATKINRLSSLGIKAFLIDLGELNNSVADFLDAEVLIIAIPSKNIDGFRKLILQIEKSRVQNIIFISSTSVYENSNDIVTEDSLVKHTS